MITTHLSSDGTLRVWNGNVMTVKHRTLSAEHKSRLVKSEARRKEANRIIEGKPRTLDAPKESRLFGDIFGAQNKVN